MNPVHFSSATVEWETPAALFEELNREFRFSLDVCASEENAKCESYYSEKSDGLRCDWVKAGGAGAAWCNPPYGRTIGAWVAMAAKTARLGRTVVMLVPARTDTRWFHDHIWDHSKNQPRAGVELRLLPGRLKFGNAKSCAPFPSAVVVFRQIPDSKVSP